MQTLILNAFEREDEFAHQTLSDLTAILAENGNTPTTINLIGRKIADCTGCFRCWTSTPGECAIKDDARAITAEMAKADRIVFFCPVVFGDFSPELKRVVERSISLLLPFMRVFHGEMHHNVRYGKTYHLCGVGILENEDLTADASFRKRVQRLSLNFNGLHYCAGTLARGNGQNTERLRGIVQKPRETGNTGTSAFSIPLIPHPEQSDVARVKSALMLCGSPKGIKGSSWEIGSYLMRQLETKGVTTRCRAISPNDTLIADIRSADLIILSFPLYADGIPARLTAVLKDIATADVGPKFCAALVQCGFIESFQNDTAIEMCRLFARDAGFTWLGGLGRGGGGMLDGKPMEQAPAPLAETRRALNNAAGSLAQGMPIPEEAGKAFRAQLLPRWIYAAVANLGFLMQSIGNGALFSIWRKPYL